MTSTKYDATSIRLSKNQSSSTQSGNKVKEDSGDRRQLKIIVLKTTEEIKTVTMVAKQLQCVVVEARAVVTTPVGQTMIGPRIAMMIFTIRIRPTNYRKVKTPILKMTIMK